MTSRQSEPLTLSRRGTFCRTLSSQAISFTTFICGTILLDYKMGRRYKKGRKVVVMSPIQELSESRSPTPECGLPVKQECTRKILVTADTAKKSDISIEQLMCQAEEYHQAILTMQLQLREERELNAQLNQDATYYRTEHFNYVLSSALDSAEIERLRDRLQMVEKSLMAGSNGSERLEAKGGVEKVYSKLAEKNKTMTTASNNKTRMKVLSGDRLSEFGGKSSMSPSAPLAPVKDHRRPYTGKSRSVVLPPISDTNNVVLSQQTTSNVSHVPNHPPSLQTVALSFVPAPPSYAPQSTGRRHKAFSQLSSLVPRVRRAHRV